MPLALYIGMARNGKERVQREGGRSSNRHQEILSSIIALAFFLVFIPNSFAGGNSNTIRISANILPKLSSTIIRQAQIFSISPENVSRGYMEIPVATVIRVKTNSTAGYHLNFEVVSDQVQEVWVIDNHRTTILSNGVSIVRQADPGSAGEEKQLSYRFYLNPKTLPGTYSWPVSVNASY